MAKRVPSQMNEYAGGTENTWPEGLSLYACLFGRRSRKTILQRREQIEDTSIKDVIENFEHISMVYMRGVFSQFAVS